MSRQTEEEYIEYSAFTSTKDASGELLDVQIMHTGNWYSAIYNLHVHLVHMYERGQELGDDVTMGPIHEFSLLTQTQRTFTMNAYGYFVGICTGGLAEADAMVAEALRLSEQRIQLAQALVHALREGNFQPGREITEADIHVLPDEIRILRRSEHPPFIGDQ